MAQGLIRQLDSHVCFIVSAHGHGCYSIVLPCGTRCIPSDTSIMSDYALNTLFHIGGTQSTTCGTNSELEDNAECTYSGTRELACNTCV